MGRIIGIISGKGGVGKTTIALNLGASLSHHFRKNVTVVDCNLTASHLAMHLGMYHCPSTINNVLRDLSDMSKSIYPHISGMSIVPASIQMEDLVGVDISRLGDILKGLKEKNDIVILDASPGFGREAMGAIKASDELLFVTTPHLPSVMDVVRFHQIKDQVDAKPIGIVSNMVGLDKYEISKDEIEYFAEMPVISYVRYDKNVRKSLSNKVPFSVEYPKSNASREVIRLASHIAGTPLAQKKSSSDAIRSVFRRF